MKVTSTRGRRHVRVEGEDMYKKIKEEKALENCEGENRGKETRETGGRHFEGCTWRHALGRICSMQEEGSLRNYSPWAIHTRAETTPGTAAQRKSLPEQIKMFKKQEAVEENKKQGLAEKNSYTLASGF